MRIIAYLKRKITRDNNTSTIIEVASIPTINYKEVIEIRVPTRFYWDEEGFDGI